MPGVFDGASIRRGRCRDEVINVVLEQQRRAAAYAQRDGRVAQDEFFDAEQNARLVRNADYYRSMPTERIHSD